MTTGRPKLKTESSSAGPKTPESGSDLEPQPHPRTRRLGIQAANNRATAWRKAHPPLSADQDALLGISARLLIHAINLSNRLYVEGELRQDGEPKAAMKTLLDYHERVTESLQMIFYDDDGGVGDNPLSAMFGKGRS